MTSTSLEMDEVESYEKHDEGRQNSPDVMKIHKTKKTGGSLSFSITNILQASNRAERWKTNNNKSLTVATKYLQERLIV